MIQRLQKRYETAGDYRAKFTQKYTYAATGRERTSTGELLVKKPGRMRWNYEGPEPQMYLASEGTLWVYEPEAKQAYRQDLKVSQLPAAVSFLMGKGKLSDEFEISLAKELPYGDPQDHRLALKPKKPQSTYKAIYLVVDPKTYLVRQSVLDKYAGGRQRHHVFRSKDKHASWRTPFSNGPSLPGPGSSTRPNRRSDPSDRRGGRGV